MNTFVVEYLKERYQLEDEIILPWVIHTVSLGESSIDEIIGEMETLTNPSVGLLAHPGQTDVRVTAKARSTEEARRMMEPVLQEIREKLADYIFGENEDTIQSVVAAELLAQNMTLCVLEVGTDALIYEAMSQHLTSEFLSGQLLDVDVTHDTFKVLMQEYRDKKQADFVLGVMLTPVEEHQELYVALLHSGTIQEYQRFYSGPPGDAGRWALNVGLDQVRTRLKHLKGT